MLIYKLFFCSFLQTIFSNFTTSPQLYTGLQTCSPPPLTSARPPTLAFAAGTTREEDEAVVASVVVIVVGVGVGAEAWRKTWNTAELETA